MNAPTRRPTNLSLDADLVAEAKALKVNVSRAAEDGLAAAVREARRAAWLEENAAAIAATNDWIAENGLPLEKYRMF